MAKALVSSMVGKIGGVVMAMEAFRSASSQDEGKLMAQIQSSMERIKSELEVMQTLKRMDVQKDEAAEAWLKRVSEVAEHLEKVVEEYSRLSKGESKKSSLVFDPPISHFSGNTGAPNNSALQQIAAQLKEIEADLDHISKMKVRWGILT